MLALDAKAFGIMIATAQGDDIGGDGAERVESDAIGAGVAGGGSRGNDAMSSQPTGEMIGQRRSAGFLEARNLGGELGDLACER